MNKFFGFCAGALCATVALMGGYGVITAYDLKSTSKKLQELSSSSENVNQLFAAAKQGYVFATINNKKCIIDAPHGISKPSIVYMACTP